MGEAKHFKIGRLYLGVFKNSIGYYAYKSKEGYFTQFWKFYLWFASK